MKSSFVNKSLNEKPILNTKSTTFTSKNSSISILTQRQNYQFKLNCFKKNEPVFNRNTYLEKYTIKQKYIEASKNKIKKAKKLKSTSNRKMHKKNSSHSPFNLNQNISYSKNKINNNLKLKEKNKKKFITYVNSTNHSFENSFINQNIFSVRLSPTKNRNFKDNLFFNKTPPNKKLFSLNDSSPNNNKKNLKLDHSFNRANSKSNLSQFINLNVKKLNKNFQNNNSDCFDEEKIYNIKNISHNNLDAYNKLKLNLLNHFSNNTIKEENSEKFSEKNVPTSPKFFNDQITFINANINNDFISENIDIKENKNEKNNNNNYSNDFNKKKNVIEKSFSLDNKEKGIHIHSNKEKDKNFEKENKYKSKENEEKELNNLNNINNFPEKNNNDNNQDDDNFLMNNILKFSNKNTEKKITLDKLKLKDIEQNLNVQIKFTQKYNKPPITVCQLLQYFNKQNYIFIEKLINNFSNNENLILVFSLKLILKNISICQLLVNELIESYESEKEENEINQKIKMLLNLLTENLTLINDFSSKVKNTI